MYVLSFGVLICIDQHMTAAVEEDEDGMVGTKGRRTKSI